MLVDNITLAVFEDSGWYRVNYAYADNFLWGRGSVAIVLFPTTKLSISSYNHRCKVSKITLISLVVVALVLSGTVHTVTYMLHYILGSCWCRAWLSVRDEPRLWTCRWWRPFLSRQVLSVVVCEFVVWNLIQLCICCLLIILIVLIYLGCSCSDDYWKPVRDAVVT